MAHKFVLSIETRKLIDQLQTALTDEAQEHRDAWDERSEKWQESDAGTLADEWIESFDALIDALEDMPEEADA